MAHNRRGNINTAAGARDIAATIAATATASAMLAAYVASRLSLRQMLVLYTASLAALLAAVAVTALARKRRRAANPRLVALTAGCLAGFEKAVTGGGFSILIASAQALAGIDVKTAIALTPLIKLPAFLVVAALYYVNGYMSPLHAAALSLGALLSLPAAATLLRRSRSKHIAGMMAVALLAALTASVARLLSMSVDTPSWP